MNVMQGLEVLIVMLAITVIVLFVFVMYASRKLYKMYIAIDKLVNYCIANVLNFQYEKMMDHIRALERFIPRDMR